MFARSKVLLAVLCAATLCVLATGALPSPQEATPVPPQDPIPAALERSDPARILGDVERLVGFGTRHTLSETGSDSRGIGAARRWLRSELEAISSETGGWLEVREQRFTAKVRGVEAELVNVYGFLPGLDVGEYGRTYVVSGHYDSRAKRSSDAASDAPGANDDASGTAVVLEVARLLATGRYRANLVFLVVPGEEQGLFGSKHFASEAQRLGWDIDGMITNDIVGGVEGGNGIRDERTIRCFSGRPELDPAGRQLARAIKESAERYVPDATVRLVFRVDRFGRGGDHKPFQERGVPAVRFTEANEHYRRQHEDVRVEDGVQYGDLAEFVSAEYMGRVARVNAAALAELALAPAPPTQVAMRAAVSYDTQMGWAPSEHGADGYEIVWRDTTAPVWTHGQVVPPTIRTQPARGSRPERQVVQGTVEGVTADTHFFGVRALSEAGHRSRVVMPEGL